MEQSKIRNFSIIAHIDHGKSTLADRILEQTEAVAKRDMEDQILDNMDLERERGITIKAHAVTLVYRANDGEAYTFNLIDTPGHVDFNYEVSRSLAACEGAVLVVDASQGIEAQTLANTYLAVDAGLEVVPVLNKIDLISADPDKVAAEIEDVIGIPAEDAPRISAKTGLNIKAVMEKIVTDIPAPQGDPDMPLRALIFDSYYDAYRGVIAYVRIKEGTVHPGDTIRMMAVGSEFTVVECGILRATSLEPAKSLSAGEVGYITASIKNVREARVGDTITLAEEPITNAHIYSPTEFVGNIMELCQDRRGIFKDMKYIDTDRVDIHYELPLNEIIYDFFDALKSRTRGYASFDYELIGYRKSELVKLDIMLNGEVVDALSFIIHAEKAYPRARKMVEKLKEKIPRQLFEVPVQACIGGKIIARETVKAMRKDVLAKCYGGDITRKKKLLEKQKEGKKRMRQLGTVEVPQEAFMAVLKLDE